MTLAPNGGLCVVVTHARRDHAPVKTTHLVYLIPLETYLKCVVKQMVSVSLWNFVIHINVIQKMLVLLPTLLAVGELVSRIFADVSQTLNVSKEKVNRKFAVQVQVSAHP